MEDTSFRKKQTDLLRQAVHFLQGDYVSVAVGLDKM